MYNYPHTIENGSGEYLTFVRRANDADGEYLEVENRVTPGAGPPMHVHHLQEEALTVRKGRIGYQVLGEEPKYAGQGETVTFKAGVAHKFWNAGDDELECTGYVRPPDNIEYFLTEIYASTKANGGKQPHPVDAAFLAKRYASEFDILEIPQFVQKTVFPIQRLIGRMTGRYKKYHGAPEPVKR